MTAPLPPHPSLENVKKQAKTLLRQWRAGQPQTLERVRAAHPRSGAIIPRLTDCQLVLAREAGFESWPQMKAAIEAALAESAGEFVETACLCYDDPHYDHRSFHARAHEMLVRAGREYESILWLLVARGASPAIREPFYDATPVGWADFFEKTRMRDILLDEGAICLFDALDYDRLDRVPDILARDPAALNRPFAECVTRDPQPKDQVTPLVRMVDRGNVRAVRVLLDYGADATGRHPDGRSLMELARDRGFTEITDLLALISRE